MVLKVTESLTTQEKVVLRLVQAGVPLKAIYAKMDVQPETVRVHLRHAREKLNVSSSFDAARLLAAEETGSEIEVTPSGVIPQCGPTIERDEATWGFAEPAAPDVVRETPASVPWFHDDRPKDAPITSVGHNDRSPLHRLALTVAIIVGLVLSIIAAPALLDSFHRVANSIRPQH